MTFRRDARRLATGAAVVTGALLTSVPLSPIAQALPQPPIGQCDPQSRWYTIDGKPSFTLTHVAGYQAPPGGSVTVTKSAETIRTLKASVDASVEGKISVGKLLAKAETKYKVALAAVGSTTRTEAQTLSYNVSASKKDRYYAIFSGRRYWSGEWHLHQCSRTGTSDFIVESGNWRSFQSNIEGGALCPATRYKSGTLANKACKATWE